MARFFNLSLIELLLLSGISLLLLFPLGAAALGTPLYLLFWAIHLLILSFCEVRAFGVLKQELLKGRFLHALAGCGAIFLLGVAALQGWLPITARDALIYHLEVPKLWLRAGRIIELPWNEWSYFPLLDSFAYAGFLKLGVDFLCPLYHLLYLPIGAALILTLLAEQGLERPARLAAGVLICSTPLFLRLASEPMADLSMATWFCGAFYCTVRFASEQRRSDLLSAGTFLGLMLATKYNSVLAVAIFLGLMPVLLSDYGLPARRAFQQTLLAASIAALVFSGWPLQNMVWTGNPFFPFLQGVFGGHGANVAFMGAAPLVHRLHIYGESWLEIALIPLRVFFTGEDGNPAQFDGVLTPLLLIGVWAVGRIKEQRFLRFTLFFSVSYFLLSLVLFHALIRYQTPVILLLCLLSGIVLGRVRLKSLVIYNSCLLLNVAFAFYYLHDSFTRSGGYDYLRGRLSRDAYLQRHIPEYEMIKFANSNVPVNENIYLLLTGNRYYLYEPGVRGSYFSATPVLESLKEADPAKALAEFFNNQTTKYVLINKALTQRVFSQSLDAAQFAVWQEFINSRLEPLRDENLYFLGRILP
ncbi:MAG: glycosyltransferase family 39 protein [Oligoflexia bacterium]|nr:glycosyltransferase family 39 protein [Oligoflexia bacterium]